MGGHVKLSLLNFAGCLEFPDRVVGGQGLRNKLRLARALPSLFHLLKRFGLNLFK